MVAIGQKLLYSERVVVFGQRGCIRAKFAVVGQKFAVIDCILAYWLYSRKSGCIRAMLFY